MSNIKIVYSCEEKTHYIVFGNFIFICYSDEATTGPRREESKINITNIILNSHFNRKERIGFLDKILRNKDKIVCSINLYIMNLSELIDEMFEKLKEPGVKEDEILVYGRNISTFVINLDEIEKIPLEENQTVLVNYDIDEIFRRGSINGYSGELEFTVYGYFSAGYVGFIGIFIHFEIVESKTTKLQICSPGLSTIEQKEKITNFLEKVMCHSNFKKQFSMIYSIELDNVSFRSRYPTMIGKLKNSHWLNDSLYGSYTT